VADIRAPASDSGNAASLTPRWAQRVVLEIAQASGGRLVTRPVFPDRPDLDMKITSAEPMLGLQIAAGLERTAKALAADYIRHAREDGYTWHEIGVRLGLSSVEESGDATAEAAYEYATVEPVFGRRSISWVCPACKGTVIDRGPDSGHPADCENGHRTGCPRLDAAIVEWQASWEHED
jgi:hypothetical protein